MKTAIIGKDQYGKEILRYEYDESEMDIDTAFQHFARLDEANVLTRILKNKHK